MLRYRRMVQLFFPLSPNVDIYNLWKKIHIKLIKTPYFNMLQIMLFLKHTHHKYHRHKPDNILSICNKVLIIQFIAAQPNSPNNNQELLIKIKNIFSEYEIIAISITKMSWSLFHSLLVNITTTFVKHSCPASGILCTLIPQTSGRP